MAPTLVGRAAELELLVETALASPAVAVIEGEAGIGKTRLVAELSARPELAKRRWLQGGCRKIREPFPLGPVIEAVRGLGGDELSVVKLSPVVGALRPLLPELTPWLPLPPEPLDDRAAERHRVFRGLTELLASVGPVVLVLEDLHWADEQTAEFLTYLFGDPPQGLSVVLTYRGEETEPGIRAVTAKVPAAARRVEVVLDPLDVEQTGTLAASILGADRVSADFAEHLCARASGVPFAVEELLALLRARGTLVRRDGRWERKALDELDVPAGIRAPILERVGRLPAGGRAVVEAAAVLQDPVPLALLLDVCALPRDEASVGAAQALAGGLLVEQEGEIGFRHVLAAQAVYEALTAPHRIGLHSRAAAAFQALDPVPLGRLAHHLRYAGRLGEWARAAEQAADLAIALGHDDEAVSLFAAVLRGVELDVERRARLAVTLGRAGYGTVDGLQTHADLLARVLAQHPPQPMRGELRFWLAVAVELSGGELARKNHLFAEAVEELHDRPDLQAWAMAGLGLVTGTEMTIGDHLAWMGRVRALLPRVGNLPLRTLLVSRVAMTALIAGAPDWRQMVEEIEQRTSGAPRQPLEVGAYQSVGMIACYAGHHDVADRLLDVAVRAAATHEMPAQGVYAKAGVALLDMCRGRWSGLAEAAAGLLDDLAGDPLMRVDVEVVAGCLALASGDLGDAHRRLSNVASSVEVNGWIDVVPFAIGALARLAVTDAEVVEAISSAEWLLARTDSIGLWVSVMRAVPPVTALLIAAGRGDEARSWVERLTRQARDLDAPLAPAALRFSEGFLAAAAAERVVAAEHFLAAAALYESLQCPYEAAQAYEQAVIALMEVGDQRAEQTLRTALSAYEGLGARWDVARCVRVGREHGMRLPVTHRGGRKGYGDRLSPREEQVARLAADGLTDKQIGAELFLAPVTVSKHLGRAMRKLGVHSRAGVAARLSRRSDDARRGGAP